MKISFSNGNTIPIKASQNRVVPLRSKSPGLKNRRVFNTVDVFARLSPDATFYRKRFATNRKGRD